MAVQLEITAYNTFEVNRTARLDRLLKKRKDIEQIDITDPSHTVRLFRPNEKGNEDLGVYPTSQFLRGIDRMIYTTVDELSFSEQPDKDGVMVRIPNSLGAQLAHDVIATNRKQEQEPEIILAGCWTW